MFVDTTRPPVEHAGETCLAGGGANGAILRDIDWTLNPLGLPERWPVSLQTATRIVLSSEFPMMLHWGPDLITIYNDAYAPSLGNKHPRSLGRPAKEWWSEIWDNLVPIFEKVLSGGSYLVQDARYAPDRDGEPREAFFTHCHSPLWDDEGRIAGIILVVTETTRQVVAEREQAATNANLEREVVDRKADRDRIWNASIDLLGISDSLGVWLDVNPAWTRALGWELEDIVGRTSEWMEHPDDQSRTRSEIGRLAEGRTTFAFVNRFRRQDGSYCQLSWKAVPAGDRLYYVGRDMTAELVQSNANANLTSALGAANQEITDQREAEKVRRVLQRELAHRLKNSFAMVQAIVTQTSRLAATGEDAGRAIGERVRALSAAQDLLISGQDDGAEVAEIITTALSPHVDGMERVSTRGASVHLLAQPAMGLALAIHELATNAAKYGALSTANGRVEVSWSERAGSFTFDWREIGGPSARTPMRKGFGSRLLERIVPGYFGGEATTTYDEDGFRYALRGSASDD